MDPISARLTTTPDAAEVLRALADSTRQKIAQLLVHEELSVSELVEVLRLPQSTVSRHLKVLREAEWLVDRREGTAVLYRAAPRAGRSADGASEATEFDGSRAETLTPALSLEGRGSQTVALSDEPDEISVTDETSVPGETSDQPSGVDGPALDTNGDVSVVTAGQRARGNSGGEAVSRAGSLRSGDLRAVLFDWLKAQPLAKAVAARLERVLARRRDESIGFFDRLGSRWDQLRSAAFGDAFAFEAMLALLPRTWTVADIGTGTGYLLPSLSAQFAKVIAVEPSAAMLGCAQRRAAEANATNIEFKQGDLGRLPIATGACDAAIACLVLHHVARPDQALSELHRIVRPGGRVLIIEQRAHENQAFYETMQDLWWGFDPTELAAKMAAVGFTGVRAMPLRRAAGGHGEAPELFALAGENVETSRAKVESRKSKVES